MEQVGELPRPDVASLLDDWDRMSEHFLPGRTALLSHATAWLARTYPAPVILEIGCGPGTTLRVLRRDVPHTAIVGIDNDPVLRRLHDISTPPTAPIAVIAADLSYESWVDGVPARPDVVLAVQMLHYFGPPRFDRLLGELRDLLEPGGVLVHLDHVPVSPPACTDSDLERLPAPDVATGSADPWTRWWADAARLTDLTAAFELRASAASPGAGSAEYHPTQEQLEDHLRRAGFGRIVEQVRHGTSLLTIASVA